MQYPDIIEHLPEAELPFDASVVKTSSLVGEHGQLVFFEILKEVEIPPHSHKAQWGTVLEGQLDLTINGETRTYGPGESYFIPAGVVHGARLPRGSKVMDFFEEADRYPLKR